MNLITKELEQKVVGISKEADRDMTLVITNQNEYETAGNILKQVKDKIKFLTDERLGITRPQDEAKKKVTDFFKVPLQKLQKAADMIRTGRSKFREEQDKKIEEIKKDSNVQVALSSNLPVTKGLSRQTWTYCVKDFAKLLDDYKIVNDTLLNSMAKKPEEREKGVIGVEFYQKTVE